MEDESSNLPAEDEEYPTNFKVLLKYFVPLAEAYPKPINKAELARLSGVTKPSITGMKHQLIKLCNKDTLLLQSKMVLEPNADIFLIAFFHSFFHGEFDYMPRLLESRYGKDVLTNLYKEFTSEFDPDLVPMDEGDLERLIELIAENMSKHDSSGTKSALKLIHTVPEESRGDYFGVTFAVHFKNVWDEFKVETKEEVLFYLKLRDKLNHVLRHIIYGQIPNLRAIKKLKNIEKRETYIEVLRDIADFYLEEFFNGITAGIKERAKGIKMPPKYKKVGTFASV